MPPRRKDNAIGSPGCAVAKIGGYTAPVHLHTAIVRRWYRARRPLEDDELSKMDSLNRYSGLSERYAQRVISDTNPLWNSMLRDTIAPTMLSAGVRANVIPSEARAMINVRLLPGDTIDVLLGELTKLVNDPNIRFEVQPDAGLAAPPSSLESDFYATITKAKRGEFFSGAPRAAVLVRLVRRLLLSCSCTTYEAYGISPFPMGDEDARRMHADDERIPLASFDKGVDFLARIVTEFAASK